MVCSGASAIPPDGDRAVGTTAPAVGNVAPKPDIGLETIALPLDTGADASRRVLPAASAPVLLKCTCTSLAGPDLIGRDLQRNASEN
jgi:hypothetical protein